MPFSYRKSIKAGPFRFNLSKSGIGASVGLAGLRFGSGPKGSYISANGARFQYKQLKTPEAQPPRPSRDEELPYKTSQPTASTHGQMEEIESGSVLNMEDSTAPDLLQSINSAYTQPFIWPAVAAASVFILMMSYVFAVEASIAWFIGFVGMVVTLATFFWDEHRRIIVLFYDLDAPMLEKFERLVQSFDDLNASSHKWHIAAKGDVYDSKYHAGASSLVDRKSIALSTTPPTSVKTNISIPTIPVGRQFLCFFPDRLFVFDRANVGAIPYRDLRIDVEGVTFAEEESVPQDAEKVGTTWRYVNKNGGPDKRFKDNFEIPIMAYEAIQFGSATGLNERIQVSLVGPGTEFLNKVRTMGSAEM